jgi:hypothetical protein
MIFKSICISSFMLFESAKEMFLKEGYEVVADYHVANNLVYVFDNNGNVGVIRCLYE